MHILVVCGGSSSERDDSLAAGKIVGDALQAAGHEVTYFDPGDDTAFMLLRTVVLDKDLVLPLLYGKGGEDGIVQSVLESLGVAHIGSSPGSARACYDKVRMLNVLHTDGVLVPPTDLVVRQKLKKHPLTKAPYILKPRFEGAKTDVRIVQDVTDLPSDIDEVFSRQGSMLIEPYIPGVELTVSIIGDTPLHASELIAGPQGVQYQCPPQNVPQPAQQQAQSIAMHVYQLLGCRHMATVDFIYTPDGRLFCIDINTLPQFTVQGAFMASIVAQGVTMPKAMDYIVQYAQQRR